MLRRLVKTGVAAALHWSGADRMIGALPHLNAVPLVLAYHSVVEDVRPHVGRVMLPNLISSAMLERQLDWIGRRYQFVTLDELGRHLLTGAQGRRRLAAVTFDDGYVGVYHHALPLLKRKGIPAGIFLVTETVGRTHLQLYDKLYLLLGRVLPNFGYSKERLWKLLAAKGVYPSAIDDRAMEDSFRAMRWFFTTMTQQKLRRVIAALETAVRLDDAEYPELHSLTWKMVQAAAEAGWTIGSHTQTHPLLTEESTQRVVNQLVGSLKTLQEKLGRPVEHFAYPDGRFNAGVVSAVADAGYRFGYGTCLHRDPRYPQLTIPRKLMWERTCVDVAGQFSPSVMSCHARRVFDLWSACGHDHGMGRPVPARADKDGSECPGKAPGAAGPFTDSLHA